MNSRWATMASGAMAYQAARGLVDGFWTRLVFLLPQVTSLDANLILSSVLFADLYARRKEAQPLLYGDVLLLTRSIGETSRYLRRLGIGRKARIVDVWEIESVRAYSPSYSTTNKPRIWIANPSHLDFLRSKSHRYASVVVDASHPGVWSRIVEIFNVATIARAPIQVVLAPPCDLKSDMGNVCTPESLVWIWDPVSEMQLGKLGGAVEEIINTERRYWVCDDEIVESLANAHQSLGMLTRALSQCSQRSHLRVAWSLYHRLRTLAVPLPQLEELRRQAIYVVPLYSMLQAMEPLPEVPKEMRPAVDAHWPTLHKNLDATYRRLRDLAEPPKFWAVAEAIERLYENNEAELIDVVLPSREDSALLSSLLIDVVDSIQVRIESGSLRFITSREEATLSVGRKRLLLGLRPSSCRYLDIYPGSSIQVIAYPYEVPTDQKRICYLYSEMQKYQSDDYRNWVLDELDFPTNDIGSLGGVTEPPSFETHECTTSQIREHPIVDFEPFAADWSRVTFSEDDSEPINMPEAPFHQYTEKTYFQVEIEGGTVLYFPAGRYVYLYYPTVGEVRHIPIEKIHPNAYLIALADDMYGDLFERLMNTLDDMRPLDRRFQLQLWQLVKHSALSKFSGSRRSLFKYLNQKELSVDYGAVTTWFREGEAEMLGPRSFHDFRLLAQVSDLMKSDAITRELFSAVKEERINRRRCGRLLTKGLIALFEGDFNHNVIMQAEALSAPIEDIVNLASFRRVMKVSKLDNTKTQPNLF